MRNSNLEDQQQDRYIFQPSNKIFQQQQLQQQQHHLQSQQQQQQQQQTTQLRKIDLNRTSNIQTILNQANSSNRSSSRNQSPSGSDNSKFISFKKNATYEKSKLPKYSLATSSHSKQSQEDECGSQKSNNQSISGQNPLGSNHQMNRSSNSLSSSSRFTPMKKTQPNTNQNTQISQSGRQNVKVIKLQLEKDKKQQSRESSLSKSKKKLDLNLSDKMSKSTLPAQSSNATQQTQQLLYNSEDHFDFTTFKNSARGNKYKDQRQSLNEPSNNQYSHTSSTIHSPNRTAMQFSQSVFKNDQSFESYIGKQLATKIEFNKIDQKFDRRTTNGQQPQHEQYADNREQNLRESGVIDEIDEQVKKTSKTGVLANYSLNDKYTPSTNTGNNNNNNINNVDTFPKYKSQTVDQIEPSFSEFEMLEQSIMKEEYEKKEKQLQLKGINYKKQFNKSGYEDSSTSNINGYFNNNNNNSHHHQTNSQQFKQQLNPNDSEVPSRDVRSSGLAPETDSNSFTSSTLKNHDHVVIEIPQNKNSLLNAMKGLSSKQPSDQIGQKPYKLMSDISLSESSSIQNNQNQQQQVPPQGSLNNPKNKNIQSNTNIINGNGSNKLPATQNKTAQKEKKINSPHKDKQTISKSNEFNINAINDLIESSLRNEADQKIGQKMMNQSKKNANNINSINGAISKLPNRNVSPTLQTSKSQQQLYYVSECSKKLFQESQDIGINMKSKENIALFKQALETRNKMMRNSGYQSTKMTSPSTRYSETKKMNSVNQNIINSNLNMNINAIERGSLTARKKEISYQQNSSSCLNNNINNNSDSYNNKHAASDNNSVTTAATNTATCSNNASSGNNKMHIFTPISKQNVKANSSMQNSANQSNKVSHKITEFKPTFTNNISGNNAQGGSSNKNNNPNYFFGNCGSLNSMQTAVSKTEIGVSQNHIEDSSTSNLEYNNLLMLSPSQKQFYDEQGQDGVKQKYNPSSPIFKSNNSVSNTVRNQKNMVKSQQGKSNSNYLDLSAANNQQFLTVRKEQQELRKSDLTSNQATVANYNFINEKSNILNKISGSYKTSERNNLEKSFNLIGPSNTSKQTITRQIQLGANNNNQLGNTAKSGDKSDPVKDRSRDHSLDRRSQNFSILRSKSSHKQIQPNAASSLSVTGSPSIQPGDTSPLFNLSNKESSQNTHTLIKDAAPTSLSKLDIKESINLTKIGTAQSNIPSNTTVNGKSIDAGNNYANNSHQRLSLTNSNQINSISKSSNKLNGEIREVQFQPSQNSTFNFKPSYFTPLNYDDLSDYIESSKRNASPTIPFKK